MADEEGDRNMHPHPASPAISDAAAPESGSRDGRLGSRQPPTQPSLSAAPPSPSLSSFNGHPHAPNPITAILLDHPVMTTNLPSSPLAPELHTPAALEPAAADEGISDGPATMVMGAANPTLLQLQMLPHELLLRILTFLDVPDLLAMSRTSANLRPLPLDPILHRQRLASIPPILSHSLLHRPEIYTLKPPRSNIYLTRTAQAARRVSRELVSARLRRRLGRRPEITDLVSRNVLPGECCAFIFAHDQKQVGKERRRRAGATSKLELTLDNYGEDGFSEMREPRCERQTSERPLSAGYIAPTLVHAKRRIERERVKDRIRAWVEDRGRQELERRLKKEEEESGGSVAGLIRRFRARGKEQEQNISTGASDESKASRGKQTVIKEGRAERWGRGAVKWAERRKRDPTRAHVLGLRRFWEGVGRTETKVQ